MGEIGGVKPLLHDRLIEFAGRVCAIARRYARDPVLENIHRQLARSATSPAANYAEAREATSRRDYVYRMKICAKELRESHTWLQIARRAGYDSAELDALIAECNELIAITLTCARKASGS